MVVGRSLRDVALLGQCFILFGREIVDTRHPTLKLKNSSPLPKIFDTVFVKSEGVAYLFIDRELAGIITLLDSKDIWAREKSMESRMDVFKLKTYHIKKGEIGGPSKTVVFDPVETKRSKTVFCGFHGVAETVVIPLNDDTTGCILYVKENFGQAPKTFRFMGKDFTGGLAYWDNRRLERFFDSLDKSFPGLTKPIRDKGKGK